MLPWNKAIFLALNAPEPPGGMAMLVSQSFANLPTLLAPLLLGGLWVWGEQRVRAGLIATGLGLFVGQLTNWCVGQVVFQPRPFMMSVGRTWIDHVADNGFPSDHTTLAWSLGLGLILTGSSRRWGTVACVVGLAAGWARVYLGVHFPLDVLASAPTALVAAGLARVLLPTVRRTILPVAEQVSSALIGSRRAAAQPTGDGTSPGRDRAR